MKRKVRGSAMLEATIGVVIISLCVAFSYSYISGLLIKDQSAIRIKSWQAVDILNASPDFKNGAFSFNGFEVYKSVSPYNNIPDVFLFEYEIIDGNNKTVDHIRILKRRYEES